jgi:hypothetical protein
MACLPRAASLPVIKEASMAATPAETNRDRAEQHALEAERLLKDRFIWSYLKAEAHATLAVYYAGKAE